MNVPQVVSDLLIAQESFNSAAFANCFSETAIAFDENNTYKGKAAIQQWNNNTNTKYQTALQPISYQQNGTKSTLTTRVSGTFEGSPIIMKYYFEIAGEKIQSLEITG